MPDSVNMVKPKIETLLFDAAGTLLSLTYPVGKSYATIASNHGIALDPEIINKAFRTVWKRQPSRESIQGPRVQDDREWWRNFVKEVLEESGSSTEAFDFVAYFTDLYIYFATPGVWHPYPDVIPTLQKLRGKYRMAIVSNFDRRLYEVLKHTELRDYFETVILSSETGIDKPDPEIFQIAMDRMQSIPANTLHIGDDPTDDLEGARNAGLECFLLRRPEITLTDLLTRLS
ncbi:MAG: HAD-IA family hydrolase [Chthoniobacterales bacterium]